MSKPANRIIDAAAAETATEAAVANTAAVPAAQDAPVDRTDFPCSVAQERFWLLDRLDPGNPSYNVAVRWRLDGRVATDLLAQSWLKIIERHEVLRTVFLEVNGAPLQRVMPRAPFRLNEIDLSGLAPAAQHAEGDRIGLIEARAPFDLSSGPLIRVTLLRFAADLSIILVTTHQIVSDGWSIGVMAREMGVIYDALRKGRPSGLTPLSIQYADYSEWQLEWLKVRGTAAETDYWTRHLAGVKPFRVIPDHPRPAMPTTHGAIASHVLPRALTNRAQALSAERGATLFATAFAAICATLARYTNESEIVVGTQVSGRDQVELEPMIGQFVNSLILRNDLSGDPPFGNIIDGVRDTIAQALEYRHIPIERLLAMLKGERSDANTPPISVNFIFQKTFIQNATHADFMLVDLPSLPAGAIYDLNLFMVERPDGWRVSCQYNTDQFERATAERLLSYFERLLDSGVANPLQRLSELPLAAADEARALLARVNDTRMLYPRDLTLQQLFEAQVARAPAAVAVICGHRQLTYAELNAAASRLAAELHRQGVDVGSRVALTIGASTDLPVCLLAILKAGGAFVLLDPTDPPQRQIDLLRAAGVGVLLGQPLERAALAATPVRLIELEPALARAQEASAPAVTVTAEAVAAVVFQSAADPATRVVGVSHRNLANLIFSLAKRPGIGPQDVVLAGVPGGAKSAAVEIFWPLLMGARLVIALDRERTHGRALLGLLQRTSATVWWGDAHTWDALPEGAWPAQAPRKLLVPALDLDRRLIRKLAAVGELWSGFGFPETGIWSTMRLVKPDALVGLGEPIANTVMFVLGSNHAPAPVGAVGELYVGGDGLTPRALAAALTGDSGVKLFPTGCAARLQSAGHIEYLGRVDDRFVQHGRWVDPREIERVLQSHSAVAEAAVVPMTAPAIAAFAVARDPASPAAVWVPEVQRLLAASLPRDWVPSITVRDSLPHRQDGSVDRRALQSAKDLASRGQQPERPVGDIERRLAALWTAMLGVDSVALGDNFFELGGHSLLAARMLTQVEREFGKRIKLATLFLAPTLRDFAKILAQGELRDFDFRQVVKIQPHGLQRPLIAINNTGIYYGVAKNLGPDQPVYSLQLFDPAVRDSRLPDSLEEIAKGYVELIRRVQPQGPYDLAGWCVAGALALDIARQLAEGGQQVANLFLIDSWVPNYFERVPRLRGIIGSYSLRGQLILEDFRRVLRGEKSFMAFIRGRTLYQRLRRLADPLRSRQQAAPPPDEQSSAETYDQWLLQYLQRLTARYAPRPYRGRITLLRSRLEPSGWLFLEDAGWAAVALDGIDVHFVDGNHFTMFQDPGSGQMADYIAAALGRTAGRRSIDS